MKSDARWIKPLVDTLLSNLIIGGVVCSVSGAFCLGLSGAFVGWLANLVQGPASIGGSWGIAAAVGIYTGGASGGLSGALIFAVAAFKQAPRTNFQPLWPLSKRVIIGQCASALSALSAFVIFELIRAQLHNRSFLDDVSADSAYFGLGAPALMICGAIVGALWKRGAAKSATLNAE